MKLLLAARCAVLSLSVFMSAAFSPGTASAEDPIRIGHFPNVTHAQALIGRGSGELEKTLGLPISWQLFNAGPAEAQALIAGELDLAYIGPNPAINAYIRSGTLRILAGSTSGGAALVLKANSPIFGSRDFNGAKISVPQFGNTQDVAARTWFAAQGFKTADRGGKLNLIPLLNPDQLLLMQRGDLDGAWTIEPWVSRLEQEAGAKVFLEERDLWPGGLYPTVYLVASKAFLDRHPAIAVRFVAEHISLTERLRSAPARYAAGIRAEIQKETGSSLNLEIIERALTRIEFTSDLMEAALVKSFEDAKKLGYLPGRAELSGIFAREVLEQANKSKSTAGK